MRLTLTFNAGNSARSAFLSQPVAVRDFTANFSYVESSGTAGPADGVALVWQNSGSGAGALGATGGGLGYSGISPSAAVEINVYNGSPPARGTNYATNGSDTGTYLSTTATVNPASGNVIGVTLVYDGVSTLTRNDDGYDDQRHVFPHVHDRQSSHNSWRSLGLPRLHGGRRRGDIHADDNQLQLQLQASCRLRRPLIDHQRRYGRSQRSEPDDRLALLDRRTGQAKCFWASA